MDILNKKLQSQFYHESANQVTYSMYCKNTYYCGKFISFDGYLKKSIRKEKSSYYCYYNKINMIPMYQTKKD